jgi:hypothetical protein
MKVAEKDKAVHGLLQEEYRRCRDALASLAKKADRYPKGSLNARKKRYKDKEYEYHYLAAREKGRVVNRHIPKGGLEALRRRLDQRDKCRQEIRTYKKRIGYLEKFLQAPRGRGEKKEEVCLTAGWRRKHPRSSP